MEENQAATRDYSTSLRPSGVRIALNPIIAPVIGIKTIESARLAVELDLDNYFGYVQLGNLKYYIPSAFGGSKKEALAYYLKARELIEKNPEDTIENWNYLWLLAVIGQSYYYLHDYVSAKSIYDQILEIEPGFLYLTDELYPELLKKMRNL